MGGGGAAAKNTSKTLDSKDINISQKTFRNISQNCITTTKQSNKLNIVASRLKNVNVDQKNAQQSLCVLQSIFEDNKHADIADQVAKKLLQTAESEGNIIPAPGSENTSEMIKTMKLEVNQDTMENIMKDCIMQQNQENIINMIASDVEGSAFNQTNANIAKCMSTHKSVSNISNELESILDQDEKQDAKSKGGSILGGLFGGLFDGLFKTPASSIGSVVICVIICIISIIASVALSMSGGGGGGRGGSSGGGGGSVKTAQLLNLMKMIKKG
jgi:hypothetical protein